MTDNLVRKSFHEYEEITVKKTEKADLLPEDKLVIINDHLDAIGKVAFANCARLNPMQSIVFECAYKTNKNMLVAAPTGAGKTNVAMLTVLNELRNYFKPNTTQLIADNVSDKFKIIYIAPMKSLASEQTDNFNTRLKKLGIKTRELTGDMSLTAHEMSQTHIIVTTPEKWDVVTRKSKGDINLLNLVRLLIIDEVHLLQSDRGPVLEALVARTLRHVEKSQRMTRIIGLSATLPNYHDVAKFLMVNPDDGMFYFDQRYRPVPLTQTFIGVRPPDAKSQAKSMDRICYKFLLQYVTQSKQCMIFVHTRNSTQRVATTLREMIQFNNKLELFQPDLTALPDAARLMANPRTRNLKDLFNVGFGMHHAGMIRQDRLLVEKLFRAGVLKVLVCTATLAWGVNFPAHAVIIRGTEIYDSAQGKFVDIGLLDVTQIFGRAGRPQYDTEGHAIIVSAVNKMDSYLKLLTNQTPIESSFVKHLTDNLNAEIASGTITSIDEGMEWLSYTYLSIRLAQNPLVYGCEWYEIEMDPSLTSIRRRLIVNAARQLDEARMCYYDEPSGLLEPTDLGIIASHFYINYATITRYNELIGDNLEMPDILRLIAEAQEFHQLKFREEEANDLENLRRSCKLPIAGGVIEATEGKVSCLLQAYISRSRIEAHSLISDLLYIAQNATRIARGLFEYSLKKRWPLTTLNLLRACKMLELQTWDFHTPFRHFDLPPQVLQRIEETQCSVVQIETMTHAEIAKLVKFPEKMGATIKDYLKQMPYILVEGEPRAIRSNLLVIDITISPYFKWNERYHGRSYQSFWMWVVDEELTNQIQFGELIRFSKEQVVKEHCHKLSVKIPLIENTLEDGSMGQRLPSEYIVYVLSNDWNGCDYEFVIDCRKVVLPDEPEVFTKVPPNLNPLPLTVFHNELYETLFNPNTLARASGVQSSNNQSNSRLHIDRLNVLQSQVFYPLYRSERNMLICAPPGSGKTVLADIAALRALGTRTRNQARYKVIYITPMSQLANVKYHDWRDRFQDILSKQVIIMSENLSDDLFDRADVIVSSGERFHNWLATANSEQNLQRVAVIIFDDVHLKEEPRGAIMNSIVAKLNNLKFNNTRLTRMRYVCLSNTVNNNSDLVNWLGIKKIGAYNFQPSARPVQLNIHIVGIYERHYVPRMAMMNKPIFKSIQTYSPEHSTIVYVSSKKQCLTTASELVSFLVHDGSFGNKKWLHMEETSLNNLLETVQDENLKLALTFGIGFLFPSMSKSDKKTVEELYSYDKIQVLICTTNYAWDSMFRARLVIVKGTEHYDVESERYTDYPSADIIQMIGRAGRPSLDSCGIAIVMIRDDYKEFFQKFLYAS